MYGVNNVHNVDEFEEELSMLEKLNSLNVTSKSANAYVSGLVGPELLSVRVLLDTGAISNSYISKRLVDEHKDKWSHFSEAYSEVMLADKVTKMSVYGKLRVQIKLMDDMNNSTAVTTTFNVINIPPNEVILGLPDILLYTWPFVRHVWDIRSARMINSQEKDISSSQDSFLSHLFSKHVEPAEEELLDDFVPASFSGPYDYLGKEYSESVRDFKNLFDEHISDGFRKATKIVELITTKGLLVFVPKEWNGIVGVDPIKLPFKDSFPDRMKPKARPVNPRLFAAAQEELRRLRIYFYEDSRSNWASPLVIAPKATKPFIRFCGDYQLVNKHIPTGHYYIPNVRRELEKIVEYPIFIDLDMTNAYHQLRLHPETSERLSLQTPWGQVQPRFMPEGIGPGSALLQEAVRTIFGKYDWLIVIFDNILVLCKDYNDAYDKMDKVLDICIKHNVVLKFSKSFLGFTEVKFFGYLCTHKTYELTMDRKQAILKIPFPVGLNKPQQMRRAIGCGVFFSPFVKNYSLHVAHLPDLTKEKSVWNEVEWKHDYRLEFENFKKALTNSCKIYYPDYSLDWIVRTDASDVGCGGMLIQLFIRPDGTVEEQIIALVSWKFSDKAKEWSTYEKEAYAIYHTVKKLKYYLVGKHFKVETDHSNLQWMENSEVAKIIRWRVFLDSFDADICYIKGCNMGLPDSLSRLFNIYDQFDPWFGTEHCANMEFCNMMRESLDDNMTEEIWNIEGVKDCSKYTREQMFSYVHNCKKGHWGVKTTWKNLNKNFPGHGISMLEVDNLVNACVTCQKARARFHQELVPIYRSMKTPDKRTAIGIDEVTITPAGKDGSTHIVVVVNLFTKFVALYPVKSVEAIELAICVWQYWCAFGRTDMIVSDKGPALNSGLMKELTKLAQVDHQFSITDRHANGCERLIQEVSRHLRAIVYDTRISDVFGDRTIIPSCQAIMNDNESSENGGFCPFEMTFGSSDLMYKAMLSSNASNISQNFLKSLNENFNKIKKISAEYQRSLDSNRKDSNPAAVTVYAKGDFVMLYKGPSPRPKMSTRFKGPFVVLKHVKNDVEVRDVLTDAITTFSSHVLQPFFGTLEDAKEAALRDSDQYVVNEILSYRGDSTKRTAMVFKVEFADGDIVDVPYTSDLLCEQFDKFCHSKPYLKHLTMDSTIAASWMSSMRRLAITDVAPGDVVWVNLRFFGDVWYDALMLPNSDTQSYVTKFVYKKWLHKTSKNRIVATFVLSNLFYTFDAYQVFAWGNVKEPVPGVDIVVDEAFALKYPQVLSDG